MRPALLCSPGRVAGLWLWLALAGLVGCGTPAQRTVFDSQASYNRSFDIALAAMADQKMIFSVQDRRFGTIVAERNGDTITATLQLQVDGTIRVAFSASDQPSDPDLLKRVAAGFGERMSQQARILPPGTL
jgi:hypothetical protein